MNTAAMEEIYKLKPVKARQIGMIVRDIDRSVEYFSKIYNIRPWFRARFTEMQTFYRGKEVDLAAEVAVGFSGGVEIELIQMNNDVENLYSDVLRKQDGGIHHIGFFVKDIDRQVAAMKAMGVEPIQSGRLKSPAGAVTTYAYFDTVDTCGVITEFIETKFFGVTMPHAKFLMQLSSITGDVTRIIH